MSAPQLSLFDLKPCSGCTTFAWTEFCSVEGCMVPYNRHCDHEREARAHKAKAAP